MDLGVDLVADTPGALTMPVGNKVDSNPMTQHMFTGMEITEKGVQLMCDYVAQVREMVRMDIPLSADHFGHIGVNSCIRLGKALTKYNMAWLEDMIPWQRTEQLKQIADAMDIPILTGEDIYLKENFIELCRAHAVDIIHPDLATSGGILETKKIGDAAEELGVPMAMSTLRARRFPAWRTCTARPRRRTSWCWRTIRWTCRGGATWWKAEKRS